MRYDPLRDPEMEKDWLEKTEGQNVDLTSSYIIIGPAGAALQIEECEFTKTWFRVDGSAPHVTLYLNEGRQAKDLGPMMLKATEKQWEATENPFIFQTPDMTHLKILCTTNMTGTPKLVVEEEEKHDLRSTMQELILEMEKQVPIQLWSRHDTDVGLVKSANPVRIEVKPGVQTEFRRNQESNNIH